MLEKFEKFNRRISTWAARIGFGALFLMVLLTCANVIGGKLFRYPVFGALDVMMLAQLIAISFAGSLALIQNRHIQVDFFMDMFPKRVQAVVAVLVHLLCLVLFMLIVWRLFLHGYYLKTGGEETPTARILLYPFSYAAALAIVPMCLVILQQFIHAILKVVKNEP
ncbi:MAG: TRAP transporter small permease [Desulfobacterales bacterium]|nr:TRAP transporter small permease [Desulfobacterales bacterium]